MFVNEVLYTVLNSIMQHSTQQYTVDDVVQQCAVLYSIIVLYGTAVWSLWNSTAGFTTGWHSLRYNMYNSVQYCTYYDTVQQCTVQYCTIHNTVQQCVVLYRLWHSTKVYSIVQFIEQYNSVQYCTVYRTVQLCTVLYIL